MIDKLQRDRNRWINGFLLIVALALLAASIYSVYLAWRTGLAQSRAETASRLMAIRTTPRSTETPGIHAWVSWSLLHQLPESSSGVTQSDSFTHSSDRAFGLRHLVNPRMNRQFPVEFQPLLDVLRIDPTPTEATAAVLASSLDQQRRQAMEFRTVNLVRFEQEELVLTARDNDYVRQGLTSFATEAAQHLSEIKQQWLAQAGLSLQEVDSKLRSAHVARFYVLSEDESLISLPLSAPSSDRSAQAVTNDALLLSEQDEFGKNPLSPSFVSNNFFFKFRFREPLQTQAMFSGMYLDLGGRGLVASVTRPIVYQGKRCVLGADVAIDMDWKQFAASLSRNLISDVIEVDPTEGQGWSPWNEFYRALPESAGGLRSVVGSLAELETIAGVDTERKTVYLATSPNKEDVIAIQVNRSTWLLLLVVPDEVQLPWTMMLLTGGVFLSVLMRVELGRRRAVRLQATARNEMQEKQNLLETMQVPLMVVDPNTDEVVFCNNAAKSIGMRPGCFFGKDIVATNEAAQRAYRRTQTVDEVHRRAYGVPIRTVDGDGNQSIRHAVVRSVAVSAPINSLRADQRHRLGILFLVDEAVDLPLLLDQRIRQTELTVKRRLASLMNHGLDSLARILVHCLASSPLGLSAVVAREDQPELVAWLSGYLSNRIQLLAWTLENWDRQPSTTEQRVIERETVVNTIDQLNQVFEIAAQDRRLRERLHWNNGLICGARAGGRPVVQLTIDWDQDTCFAIPREGVFGFLINELLVNAVRHGGPKGQIQVDFQEQRHRNELVLQITNDLAAGESPSLPVRPGKPYGGLAIVNQLVRLCGWDAPEFVLERDQLEVRLVIPTMRRDSKRRSD